MFSMSLFDFLKKKQYKLEVENLIIKVTLNITVRPSHFQFKPSMENFVEVYDEALSVDFCQRLIALFDQSPHQQAGRAGGVVDLEKKQSRDIILNQHAEFNEVAAHIAEVTAAYLQRYLDKYRFALIAPIALTLNDPETGQARALTIENFDELAGDKVSNLMQYLYRLGHLQAQKYPQGSGNYNYWHCEVFPMAPHNEQLHRTLLFMFYLNDVDDGGETEFYYQQLAIKSKAGRMVIAPAYFTHTHRGCVPKSNDKYIVTSWVLLQRAEQLYHP